LDAACRLAAAAIGATPPRADEHGLVTCAITGRHPDGRGVRPIDGAPERRVLDVVRTDRGGAVGRVILARTPRRRGTMSCSG